MIDLDEIITKDGKSLRQLYSEGHKFLRCKKCNQECTVIGMVCVWIV